MQRVRIMRIGGFFYAVPLGVQPHLGQCFKGQVSSFQAVSYSHLDVYQRQEKGWFCENRECRFVLWKDNAFFKRLGKRLDAHVADKLLRDGRVRLKDCKSAKGKTYNATVLPVSYTHLDVYKRQVMLILGNVNSNTNHFDTSGVFISMLFRTCLLYTSRMCIRDRRMAAPSVTRISLSQRSSASILQSQKKQGCIPVSYTHLK